MLATYLTFLYTILLQIKAGNVLALGLNTNDMVINYQQIGNKI